MFAGLPFTAASSAPSSSSLFYQLLLYGTGFFLAHLNRPESSNPYDRIGWPAVQIRAIRGRLFAQEARAASIKFERLAVDKITVWLIPGCLPIFPVRLPLRRYGGR